MHQASGQLSSAPLGPELVEEVSRTLPVEVELLRLHQYRVDLPDGVLPFIVLKLYIPDHKHEGVLDWRRRMEDRFSVRFFIQRERIYSGLRRQLELLAGERNLLLPEHGAAITRILDHFNGGAPCAGNLDRPPQIPDDAVDLCSVPFITIDSEDTLGREDAVWAEELPSGAIRLSVAIVDITWLFQPGSYIDLYAQKLGASVYGVKRIIATIGQELALGLGSFLPQAERCAWIFDIFIRPDGTSLLSSAPYRARVAAAAHYSPELLNSYLQEKNGHPAVLGTLGRAAARLAAARVRSCRVLRVKGEGTAEMIVAESMIAAKHWSARYLAARSSNPAIFKVHTVPSFEEKQVMAAELAQLGIRAGTSHFEQPLLLAEILAALQEKWIAAGEQGCFAASLSDRILDHFLMRSRYDSRNLGHHALGLDSYLDIKPRDASGITNQFQLLASRNPHACGLPPPVIEARTRGRNRKLARYDRISFRLRFLEMLERKLAWAGTVYDAKLLGEKPQCWLLEVPGFSKWGVLPKNNGSALCPGAVVPVLLEGFNTEAMRFQFRQRGE